MPDLGVQLDVFDEQRESDEAQILHAPHGVDLNSHLDVFYAILRQVSHNRHYHLFRFPIISAMLERIP